MIKILIASLFALTPLIAGLFAVTTKPAPINLEVYLGRYAVFILLFVVWGLFRTVVSRTLAADAPDRKKQFGTFLAIAFLAIATIVCMFLFKRRFEREAYEIALIALGASALWTRSLYLKRYLPATLWGMFADTCIGFLSFQMVIFEWQWQPFIFSVPMACASVLINLSAHAKDNELAELVTINRVLLVLMPVSIGLLVFSGALSNAYLLTFIFLFLPARILASLRFANLALVSGSFMFLLLCIDILLK